MILLKQERGKRKKKDCNCGNSVAKIEKIKKKGNFGNGFVEIGERGEKNNDMLKRSIIALYIFVENIDLSNEL